jgi:NADP-dependent aldehyde dehydrogenase
MKLIDERPSPIPFYGELGSINPLVVTPAAAEERADGIGRGLAGSMSLGVGQFCTKPGLAFVPVGDAGDQVVNAAAVEIRKTPAGVMLNANISAGFAQGAEELASSSALRLVAEGKPAEEGAQAVPTRLFEVDLEDLSDRMLEECFGPLTIVVRYRDLKELSELMSRLPASLTSTLQTGTNTSLVEQHLMQVLQDKAGRVVFNGFPTGVAVAWAQTHGGGWPASNSLHTSVGVTAIRRFLRPITWQDAPQSLVPVELREETRGVPRRVDGKLLTDGG